MPDNELGSTHSNSFRSLPTDNQGGYHLPEAPMYSNPSDIKKFRPTGDTTTKFRRKESFIDRFTGRISMMTNEGDRGVAASTRKPIEKL